MEEIKDNFIVSRINSTRSTKKKKLWHPWTGNIQKRNDFEKAKQETCGEPVRDTVRFLETSTKFIFH